MEGEKEKNQGIGNLLREDTRGRCAGRGGLHAGKMLFFIEYSIDREK